MESSQKIILLYTVFETIEELYWKIDVELKILDGEPGISNQPSRSAR